MSEANRIAAAMEIWTHIYLMCVNITPPELLEVPTLEEHWLAVDKIAEIIKKHSDE